MSISTTPPITFTKTAASPRGDNVEEGNRETTPRTKLIHSFKLPAVVPPLMAKNQMNDEINGLSDSRVAKRMNLPSLNNLLNYSHTSSYNSPDRLEKVREVCPTDEINLASNTGANWENNSSRQNAVPSKGLGYKLIPTAVPNSLHTNSTVAIDPEYYDQRRESLEFLADAALNSSKSECINGANSEGENTNISDKSLSKNENVSSSQYFELITEIIALKNSMFEHLPSLLIGETGPTPLITNISKSELQQLLSYSRKLTSTTRDLLLLKLKHDINTGQDDDIKNSSSSPLPKQQQVEPSTQVKRQPIAVTLPGVATLTNNKLSEESTLQPQNHPANFSMLPLGSHSGCTFQERNVAISPQYGIHAQPAFRFPNPPNINYKSQSYDHIDFLASNVSGPRCAHNLMKYHKRSASGPARGRTYSILLKPKYQHQQENQGTLLKMRQNAEDIRAYPTFSSHSNPHRQSMAQNAIAFEERSTSKPLLPIQGHRYTLSEPLLPLVFPVPNVTGAQKTPNKRKRQRRSASNSSNITTGASFGVCLHCQEKDTPEWRRGPYGNRTLCNACGLFYNKLIKKFGARDANIMMHYRRRVIPDDRRVPDIVEVPGSFVQLLKQRTDLDEQYAVIQT